MRFTIERIRTLVLVAGALLLVALGAFLFIAKTKNLLSRRDLPHRLGLNITQEANGFKYVHTIGAHMQFEIDASRQVQLKDGRILLHGVRIDLYGQDGNRIDHIAGDEFDYDPKTGIATALGPVEMQLSHPQTPATGGKAQRPRSTSGADSASGQVYVKTSGVTFNRNSGQVTTAQLVNFSMTEGYGSAMGATYNSQTGYLTLEQAVELTTHRGADTAVIHAQHAEFDRDTQLCWLHTAAVDYRGGQADASLAKILFRKDGTAQHLDAMGGFTLATSTGGHVAAPTATMDLDEHNQPHQARLEGGVTMDSASQGRTVHGTSPTAELDFTNQDLLRHAHLERGVAFDSADTSQDLSGQSLRVSRSWRSPIADIDFRSQQGKAKGQVEPETIHGTGGVTVSSESRHGDAPAVPSKMTADEVTGAFGPNSALRTLAGVGHAVMEQTTATGTRQKASADRLVASFAQGPEKQGLGTRDKGLKNREQKGAAPGVESAELDGHVVLFEQPAAKPGAQAKPPLRATAGKAVYDDTGQWLYLTMSPRVVDGGMELTAEKVDISQQTDDAFAHGNIKATWTGENAPNSEQNAEASGESQGAVAFGGKGAAHVIAAEAQFDESTGEATFRGHARLWQQANSVSAPLIVLNQHLQTLVAHTTDSAEPVRAVLLSAGSPAAGIAAGHTPGQKAESNAKPATPSVIRVRGGDLTYSDAEHRAVMHSGVLSAVVAETPAATSSSDSVDLRLMPAADQGANRGGQTQVDRMTATGHVVLTSQGRRGTGQQLVYSSVTGEYVLTGTAAAPPRMTDAQRGSVTGEALIFHSRDDSVSIEGDGGETRTETTAPEAHRK